MKLDPVNLSQKNAHAALLLAATLSFIFVAGTCQVEAQQSDLDQKLGLAQTLQNKGSAKQARTLYESLLPQLRAEGPTRRLGTTLNALSALLSSDGDYEQAVQV